jgi:hypothetical protein
VTGERGSEVSAFDATTLGDRAAGVLVPTTRRRTSTSPSREYEVGHPEAAGPGEADVAGDRAVLEHSADLERQAVLADGLLNGEERATTRGRTNGRQLARPWQSLTRSE